MTPIQFLSLTLVLFTGCQTMDKSTLLQDDGTKPLARMSAEEFDVSVKASETRVESQALRSLFEIAKLKSETPALDGMVEIEAGTEVIRVDDLPTDEEVIDDQEVLTTVGGGVIDQAQAVLTAYFQDPQNKAIVTGAAVGAISALTWNRFSQRSARYYRSLVAALNLWTDRSLRSSFGNGRAQGSLTKLINSNPSLKVTFEYSRKFYGSLEKSLGVTGFKPAALAATSSLVSSSIASFWSYSDYTEEEIEEIESPEDFDKRLGPQVQKYRGKDEIMNIGQRYAKILQWNDEQLNVFYKAAIADIVKRLPEVAKTSGGKITADTIIPFDALTVIERINERESQLYPQGYLTSDLHIKYLRELIRIGGNVASEDFRGLSTRDINIIRFIDNLDTLVAANFIMAQMAKSPAVSEEQKQELYRLIAENKDLLRWVSQNFD